VRVGGVFDVVEGGFVAVAGSPAVVAQDPVRRHPQVDTDARASGAVPRRPAVEKVADGRTDQVPCVGRRCAVRERDLLEPRKRVLPARPGQGFALRLAETFVRWFSHADGREPRVEKRASEGEGRSDGSERCISSTDTATGQGPPRIFLAQTHVFQAERGARLVERCIFLACPRIFQARTGASIAERRIFLSRPHIFQVERGASLAERCIFLSRTRIFRSRAIAVVIARRIFQAYADPRTSRTRIFPARARLSRARSSASPPGMRIFQARRCTGRRGRALSLKKV